MNADSDTDLLLGMYLRARKLIAVVDAAAKAAEADPTTEAALTPTQAEADAHLELTMFCDAHSQRIYDWHRRGTAERANPSPEPPIPFPAPRRGGV